MINKILKIKKDKKEIKKIEQLIEKVHQIDEEHLENELDVIYQQQPFIISLLLGYQVELNKPELEEIIKVVILIWEYFKNQQKIKQAKISESQFMRIEQKNIHMLEYFKGEAGESEKIQFVASDLGNLRSKPLFTAVLTQLNQKRGILNMNEEIRGIVFIGLKGLIECFEEITT